MSPATPTSLQIEGQLLEKGSPEYEEARSRNFAQNAHARKQFPSYIAIVKTVEDIQKCVAFCSQEGLTINIRSGGHNWFGCFLQNNNFLIDMRHFDGLKIDGASKTATVGPYVMGQDLNEQAAKHGLCFPTGHCVGVPVGGYLLGGGLGWFLPKYGFAAESILQITVVDAAGRVIEATDETAEEWMWMARGSGSAFCGVVVSFQLKLHPLPKIIRSKQVLYPLEEFANMSKFFHDYVQTNPEAAANTELSLIMASTPPPLLEVVKVPKLLMVMMCCMADSEEEFHKNFDPLEKPPLSVPFMPGEYQDHESFQSLPLLVKEAFPPGMHWITTASLGDIDKYSSLDWSSLKKIFEDQAPPGLSHGLLVITPKHKVTKPGCYGTSVGGLTLLPVGAHGPGEDPSAAKAYVNTMTLAFDPIITRYDNLEHPVNKDTFGKTFGEETKKLLSLRGKLDPEKLFFDPSTVEPNH